MKCPYCKNGKLCNASFSKGNQVFMTCNVCLKHVYISRKSYELEVLQLDKIRKLTEFIEEVQT